MIKIILQKLNEIKIFTKHLFYYFIKLFLRFYQLKTNIQTNTFIFIFDKFYLFSSVLEQIKYKQHGIIIAGGFGRGNELNQLSYPLRIFVDNDKIIYIADWWNHGIVQWKSGEKKGQVIAGGNGSEDRNDQLNDPTDIIVDKKKNSF